MLKLAEFFVHLNDDVGSVIVKNVLGLDLGGTLAKVTFVLDDTVQPTAKTPNDAICPILRFNHNGRVYRCYFAYFQTSQIEDLIEFIQENNLIPKNDASWKLKVTGGGAYKFQDILSEKLQVNVLKCDEMKSVMAGLNFVIAGKNASFYYDLTKDRRITKEYVNNAYPLLLVNIGSGVSILKAENSRSFVRVSGTCIGGGTALGLCQLCFGAKSFKEVVKLSEKGSDALDMRISDVIGDTAGSRTLPCDTLASSFGRLYTDPDTKDRWKKEDVARSAIRMISYNIGYLGLLLAKIHNIKRVFFSGKYISDHNFTMKTITQAITFYHIYDTSTSNSTDCFSTSDNEFKDEDKNIPFDKYVAKLQKMQKQGKSYEALFLRHDGYLGAIGALLHINEDFTALMQE